MHATLKKVRICDKGLKHLSIADSHESLDVTCKIFVNAGGTDRSAFFPFACVCVRVFFFFLSSFPSSPLFFFIARDLLLKAGAGLSSWDVAKMFVPAMSTSIIPPKYFAKGNYFSFSGKSPCSRLIYPLPEPGGLGIA